MTILFGYAKSSRDFIFARASQIWAIQSIKHSTFDASLRHSLCTNVELHIKSSVLNWLNGSNLRCSSEDKISWTFCIANQYGHSCLGKPSTRCKMLFFYLCVYIHPSAFHVACLVWLDIDTVYSLVHLGCVLIIMQLPTPSSFHTTSTLCWNLYVSSNV